MPDISVSYRLAVLSRSFPQAHRFFKVLRRFFTQTIPQKWFDLLRIFAPAGTPRFGPPKGLFSIYNSMIFENRRPMRVAVTDQGAPEIREGSMMPHSGHHHHTAQPWPVFCSRHHNARLVST